MEKIADWSPEEKIMLKAACESSHKTFSQYFFQVRENSPFIFNPHHEIMCDIIDKVIALDILNLIVNVPPGYTKTELFVLMLVARGLAINPRAKFIHTSYSDNLALLNSSATKEIVESAEYQELWPMPLRADSKSKKMWFNTSGGGLYATAAGGQITGFRAGRSDGEGKEKFSGAFIMDDPIKPDDVFHENSRKLINRRFSNTYNSRLLHDKVPFILIMQRLHDDDPSAHLLKGGDGKIWHHLDLPVLIPEVERDYPSEWKNGRPITYSLPPGPLWKWKHDRKEIEELKADEYTFNSQYMQRPSPAEGGIFKKHWWRYYTEVPKLRLIVIYADTATKKKTSNDPTVFGLFGLGYDKKIYVLNIFRERMETPEMIEAARDYWNKYRKPLNKNIVGATTFKVEDKSSGTYLIQQFKREGIPVQEIPRNVDKVQRAVLVAPEIAKGNVLLPDSSLQSTPYGDTDWVLDYKKEFAHMTVDDTHDNDDQIDVSMDAIEEMLIKKCFTIYDNL